MDVANISAELTRIWDSLESSNKMRASLFNLILFTQKNERAGYIRTIAQKVIERFPSRVIFITVDKNNEENTFKASASVMMGAKGEFDVVCDLIEFEATKVSQERIPFLILPHLIPDLPVYLVWAEDPVQENPLSYQLEKLATRLIFDSESTDNLAEFAKALLHHKSESHCDIADLNWARTENWRELIALTFYSPERLEQLKKAKTIKIVYNSRESPFFCHTKIQAIYLQGWIASQLEWSLKTIENDCFQYANTSVQLSPEVNLDLSPGAIISLDIVTQDGDHFSFCRNKTMPEQILMIFCDQEKCEIPSRYLFNKTQTGLSLVNEICHSGTSMHYLKLLNGLKCLK
ncbi:MAG: glucose-6-phosphate dehydrogenase assembly protein OpcA [Rhabdochlamydiaceae bacterium]